MVEQKLSDHFSVKCQLPIRRPPDVKKEVKFRKLNKIDFDQLDSELCEQFESVDQSCDINGLATLYNTTSRNLIDKHAPEQKKFITLRNKHQGYTNEIREEKRKRRRLERRWRRTMQPVDRENFVKQKEKFRKILEDADTEFYSSLVLENSGNSQKLFKALNKIIKKRDEVVLPQHHSILQLADEFIEFFTDKIAKIQDEIDKNLTSHDRDCYQPEEPKYEFAITSFRELCETEVDSLLKKSTMASCDLDPIPTWILKHCHTATLKIMTQIINKSLQSANMPKEFKLVLLIPLLKKFGLEEIKPNFRPVSNLPYASKLIESAVANQLVEHMTNNGLFEPLQSAYRQGHSTETALLRVQNDILVAMDNQQVSILILLDLSAAFDTVNHDVLLKRLKERCGVQGEALKWFESYLTDRFQMVKLKEITSKRVALHCGLPQGSVLGPLLFLVYILLLGDIIKSKGLQFHLYADDTQIYMSFTPTTTV
eukprot:Seg3097.1 transcript_id=Seg3097.1/GoldUCD/mRNA.D3Y31 product="putative RNA-directed DNA polymerase from transposon X-element" pseudo=true protein_id=Seg3097.1/GoldUCD/D3Y31